MDDSRTFFLTGSNGNILFHTGMRPCATFERGVELIKSQAAQGSTAMSQDPNSLEAALEVWVSRHSYLIR